MADRIEMDDLISELEFETSQILDGISSIPYEELDKFIDKRQHIVDTLIRMAELAEPSSDHKIRVREILKTDAAVISRIEELRNEAQDWIRHRNQAKLQRNAYEGFGGAIDSILMDQRK